MQKKKKVVVTKRERGRRYGGTNYVQNKQATRIYARAQGMRG